MRRKWFIVIPLVATELLLCAGILVISWGGVRWVQASGLRLNAFGSDTVSATADEAQTLPVSGPATLQLDNAAGAVTVTGGVGSAVVISAHKTAWGATQAEAEAALADLKITVTQTGDTITIQVVQPAEVTVIGEQRSDSVDFTITVPADTALTLHTGFGDVTAGGVTRGVDLSASAGDVSAADVAGGVALHSDFGRVTLERAEADTVSATSSSGGVRLSDVQATGAVTLDTDFGDVHFEDGAAERLTATTSSGAVTLRDLSVAGAVEAKSSFGSLTVVRVVAGGGYDLDTSSGGVTLSGATGRVVIESGFGDVSITDATDVTLAVHSSSGQLSFAGTLGAGPHSLRTNFGDVVLKLPADTEATLDLDTNFGSLHSDLPVTLSGAADATHWQGTLGGGGPRLTVHTSSGSIRIETLAA